MINSVSAINNFFKAIQKNENLAPVGLVIHKSHTNKDANFRGTPTNPF